MVKLNQTQASIAVVLLDADGVTQTTPSTFINDVRALCPDADRADAFVRDLQITPPPPFGTLIIIVYIKRYR